MTIPGKGNYMITSRCFGDKNTVQESEPSISLAGSSSVWQSESEGGAAVDAVVMVINHSAGGVIRRF